MCSPPPRSPIPHLSPLQMYTLAGSSYKYTEARYQTPNLTPTTTFRAAYSSPGQERLVVQHNGIQFHFVVSGQLGQFDFSALLTTLTTSLTLLAVATTIVQFLALYVSKQKIFYKDMIYDESVDFSELEQFHWNNDTNTLKALQRECRHQNLPAGGSRETLIVRLFTEDAAKKHDAVVDDDERRSTQDHGRRQSLARAPLICARFKNGSRTSSTASLEEPLMPSQPSQPTRVSFDGVESGVSDVRHGGNDLSVN